MLILRAGSASRVMYNDYFGFRRSPFNLTPNPDYFYVNPIYLEAHANLRYGIESRKGFIVLAGEVGTGKTTLLRRVMRDLRPTTRFAFVFNTSLTFEDLLHLILSDFGLPVGAKDKLMMLRQLNDFLLQQYQKGFLVCLLIDEAQNLSDESLEELRLLSNFETREEKLLQIVLIGQPELTTKLDRDSLRQLKQRIAVRCEIAPLWPQEVGSYIEFRLRAAGYERKGLFDADAVREIAVNSRGIPRLINVLCDNALLLAFAAEREVVSADLIGEASRDLRLIAQPDSRAGVAGPSPPDAAVSGSLPAETARKVRHRARLAAGGFLLIVVFVAGTYVGEIRRFLVITARSFQPVAPEVTQERLLVPRQEPARQTVELQISSAPAANEQAELSRDETVTVPYGATVYEIAVDKYGANAILGMDLIKESNPRITNLNSIATGQELLLPGLRQESLARRQQDGSYHLIVGAYLRRRDAEEAARRIKTAGYHAIVTATRPASDILLHRLEITDLKNLDHANEALQNAVKHGWLTLTLPTPAAVGTPQNR